MVHPLYFVLDIVFAIVLIIILHHDHKIKPMVDSQEKAFRLLINWVIFFCLQDAVWGICASDFITSDLPLFIASSVFHFSTVLTTFFWLYYILKYLSDRILTNYRRLLLWIDILVIVLQIGLIVTNFYTPLIFEVVQGRYVPAYLHASQCHCLLHGTRFYETDGQGRSYRGRHRSHAGLRPALHLRQELVLTLF